jgi:hypothetical protein
MTRQNSTRRPLEEWSVAQLRLTIFPKKQIAVPVEDWWTAAVGEPPENVQHDRKKAITFAVGQIDSAQLAVVQLPGRVDWTWEPVPNPLEMFESLPGLGPFETAVARFRGWIGQWAPNCPESARIAFGTGLRLSMPDRFAAYHELCNYLNFDIDGKNSSEFLYQINRPKSLQIGSQNVAINCLSKWSAGVLRIVRSQFPSGSQTLPTTELNFVNLEIDINTVPEFGGVFTRQDIVPTLDRFSKLGAEIVREGDLA